MNWANPYYLFLLGLPLLLSWFYLWARRRSGRDLENLVNQGLIAKVVDVSGRKAQKRQSIARLAGIVFLIIALSGPRWGYRWQETKHRGLEIIFALDTSKSMLATDVKPNRLERSKLAVKDLLRVMQDDKVGLVAFSGTSFLQCPLTADYNVFSGTLDALNTGTIPRGGTAIGAAIATARDAFKSGSDGKKILIIITDGENHEGDPVSQAKAALKDGINVYTIGIGSPEGELIIIQDSYGNSSYLKDSAGNVVKSTLNESILKEIAQAGQGTYVRAGGFSLGLEELYRTKLAGLTKSETESKWRKDYVERYQIPLLLAFLAIVWELMLGFKVKPGSWSSFFNKQQRSAE
ncbi:MAG: VWA domain-containing protein [Bacteroidota bacterium]